MAQSRKPTTSASAVLIPPYDPPGYTRTNKSSFEAYQAALKIDRPASDVKASLAAAFNEDAGKEPQHCRLVCEFELGGRYWCLTTGWHLLPSSIVRWEEESTDANGAPVTLYHTTVLKRLGAVAAGSLPVVGVDPNPDNRFRCGLGAVVGVGDIGKSPFCHAFAQYVTGGDYGFIRYGEPFAGYLCDLEALVVGLVRSMVMDTVLVVDSFKDILSSSSGAAMKSGLNRGVLPEMSSLATAAADCGCMVLTPVNPSDPDEKVSDLLSMAMKSNVVTLITPAKDGWLTLSRTHENGPRVSRKLSFVNGKISFDQSAFVQMRGTDADVFSGDIQVTPADTSLTNLIKRAQ